MLRVCDQRSFGKYRMFHHIRLNFFPAMCPESHDASCFFFFLFFCFWRDSPQWARASSFTRFLAHAQRRTTVDNTPLDEWSARRRDLYLTIHNTHNTSMTMVGFEPIISAGDRQQTDALDGAATGTSHPAPYSMEQSPSWKANQCLQLVKEFPSFLWNPKVLYRTHKCPSFVPILSQLHPVSTTPSNFLIIYIPIYVWVSPIASFPQVSPPTPCAHFSPPPYAPHVPPISFFPFVPFAQYWVRDTDQSAPHYVTFSIPLSPRPS
jgi:hypothetical protein